MCARYLLYVTHTAVILSSPNETTSQSCATTDFVQVRAVKRFKQLLFRRRPERFEGILGSASRMVQPPLSIHRPSMLRKSKSQDTDNRRPIETVLTTDGVHHEIRIDDNNRLISGLQDSKAPKTDFRAEAFGKRSTSKPVGHPKAAEALDLGELNVVHENMSHRPAPMKSKSTTVAVPTAQQPKHSATMPGKGHAHNPLEDTLYLNIGTGEDAPDTSAAACIVSESPSNVDMNVYETAYEEEVQRIIAQRKDQYRDRRPTLYLTRRVENVKSIRDSDCIFDEGQDTRGDFKKSFKSFVTKTKEDIEARGELQKIQEGKEGKLSRTVRNVREAKRLVEEAREIAKTEEFARERERSRSSTPVSVPAVPARKDSSGSGLSRSGTPVAVEK
jgi:[calcium/calmodulin-dependent protein kinase] kinase